MNELEGNHMDERSNCTLSWYKLSVSINRKIEDAPFWRKSKYKKIDVLKDVSGIVNRSTLLAIMGPSGAGKSTLLSTIACRLNDKVCGEVRLNGELVSKEMMKEISAYLPQYDLTFEYITVLEHLNFVAAMKMDRRLRAADRMRKIYSIMTSLGLTRSSSTYLVNLSGGERKRVSLACQNYSSTLSRQKKLASFFFAKLMLNHSDPDKDTESIRMLVDPLIMFCDEPTTGLDSYVAYNIVQTLQQLARTGKIVICTIHQPASNVFEMFDELILISQGRLAYQGPTLASVEYFNRLNMICPRNYNIAEFLVSRISPTANRESCQALALCQMFEYSDEYKRTERRIKSVYTMTLAKGKERFTKFFNIKHATTWMQFWFLLYRRLLESMRNSKDHIVNLISCLIMGVTFVLFYYKHGIKDQTSIQDAEGAIFLMIVEMIFQYAYYMVFGQNERSIVLKEVNDGLYAIGPYYLSQMILKVIYSSIEPVIYGAIIYYYTDMFTQIPFTLYSAVLALTGVIATSYGTCLAYAFDSLNTLVAFSSVYESCSYMCAGVNINLNSLPLIFRYFKYVTVFFYGVESLSILLWTYTTYIPCESTCDVNCITTGNEVLMMYGYNTNGFVSDILIMLLMIIVLNIIAYVILRIRAKEQLAYY